MTNPLAWLKFICDLIPSLWRWMKAEGITLRQVLVFAVPTAPLVLLIALASFYGGMKFVSSSSQQKLLELQVKRQEREMAPKFAPMQIYLSPEEVAKENAAATRAYWAELKRQDTGATDDPQGVMPDSLTDGAAPKVKEVIPHAIEEKDNKRSGTGTRQ
jgi:hypothetical protein